MGSIIVRWKLFSNGQTNLRALLPPVTENSRLSAVVVIEVLTVKDAGLI